MSIPSFFHEVRTLDIVKDFTLGKGMIMEKLYGRTVGERLRLLRESRGLRQEDLANEFLLSGGSVVSLYENGKRQVPAEIRIKSSQGTIYLDPCLPGIQKRWASLL